MKHILLFEGFNSSPPFFTKEMDGELLARVNKPEIKEALEKLGVKDVNELIFLGSGASGDAFKSKDLPGKAIKIERMYTTQAPGGNKAKKIVDVYTTVKENNPKHIVKIFNIQIIKDQTKDGLQYDAVYLLLIREELLSIRKTLSPDERQAADYFLDKLGDLQDSLTFEHNEEIELFDGPKHIDDFTPEELVHQLLLHARFKTFSKDTLNMDLVRDVFEALKEARDIKIKLQDLHIGNIMYSPKEKIYKVMEVI